MNVGTIIVEVIHAFFFLPHNTKGAKKKGIKT